MRWLSHDHACATLRQILPSIMMSLEREAQERHDSLALGLAKNIQTVQFIYILHMMCDILPQLSTLSKCFQGSGMDFGHVQEYLDTTLDHLDARLSTPGRHFKAAPDLIKDLETHFKITRKGISDIEVFKQKIHDKFLTGLITNIKARFPDSTTLSAFNIMNPAGVRNLEKHDVEFHGEQDLETLLDQYADVVDGDSTRLEYQSFRMLLWEHRDKDISFMVTKLLQEEVLFPNLRTLAQLYSLVPASTADCERGFSALKRIKTTSRNRLSQKILNALMMVSTQGPPAREFSYKKAASLWNGLCNRRVSLSFGET